VAPGGVRVVTSLADVAALAGVSVATASRVMGNSSHPVSPEMRERVLEAARSLDYEYNMLARGLVANRSRTVGVVLHDILDEYFAQIVRGIEDVAYAAGYTTLVCNSDRDPEKELNYVRKLRSMCVDALMFTAGGLRDREHQRRLAVQTSKIEAAGRVVVHLAPHPTRKPTVYYATAEAIDGLVGHLQDLGHRRFLYVAGATNIVTSHERVKAVLASADARGMERPKVVHADFSREGGLRAAAAAAEHVRSGATAVMAANDQTALGLLEGLRAEGVRVPDDVSLAGFGDISACRDVRPALTTVRLPLYDIGAQGMRYALHVLDGGRPQRHKSLPTELVVRQSTGVPRQGTVR
jgi:LacI family transcriptional regulator